MTGSVQQLQERMAQLTDLRNVAHLLDWDQQTMMPRHGASARSDEIATVGRLSHELFISAETGRLIESAAAELDGAADDSDEVRLVRISRRRWDKARHVPSELWAELAKAGSIGHAVWIEARARSDFAALAPYLERNLELARRYVACFDGFDSSYDVLLDDYEPGMTTAEVAALFDELRSALVPLIATLSEHCDRVDNGVLHGHFPVDRQRELVSSVLALMGFDREGWRMDDAAHPFAAKLGRDDVRITTRWDEAFFASGLYGAMHECGHGLYEEGISRSLDRTPLGYAESLGLHESQSRMWENIVGRGRPFCGVLAPMIADLFGESVGTLGPDTLYRAVNRVEPSYIRVEADEATYGLHIVLRFELEQALIEGDLAVRDLPEAWNARFKEYFGLDVPDDADGVLQDVHWASGAIGYFPTYALGNLIAGQLWEKARADLPDLDERIAGAELMPLREWLRENVHRHGAKFGARELVERVVGAPITVSPFVSYLKRKLGDVYGLEL
jgi:carboxypeptidase Taq